MKLFQRFVTALFLVMTLVVCYPGAAAAQQSSCSEKTVTLQSLLAEMTDRDRLARFPQLEYQCLQASSYNRQSVQRDQPSIGAPAYRGAPVSGRQDLLQGSVPGEEVPARRPVHR